jgi:transposase
MAYGARRWSGGRYWTESEGRSAIAELSGSGKSLAQFARDKGVSPQRLFYWRKRLRETAPAFVAVELRRPSSSAFGGGACIEVVTGSVVVRVREELDVEHLARIVGALSGRRC